MAYRVYFELTSGFIDYADFQDLDLANKYCESLFEDKSVKRFSKPDPVYEFDDDSGDSI